MARDAAKQKAYMLKYNAAYRARPEVRNRQKLSTAERYKVNREKAMDSFFRKAYGITLAARNDMEMAQGHRCAICRKPSAGKRPLGIDHCHTTGRVRALLCTHCNRGLGGFYDSPGLLRDAADYLEKHRGK